MKEVLKFLNLKLNDNDKVVVACSGGPDSMYLMESLRQLKQQKNITVICAHVNHNKREQSKIEYEFVKNYCELNQFIFEGIVIEEWKDENFHVEARKKRYQFFESLMKQYQATYLMTAHHGDDLMETILMRLTRGSNLNGYAGFKKEMQIKHGLLIRPLIHLTKEEITIYLRENKLNYYIDSSNESEVYTRNRYRKHILPFLKNEYKDVHHKYYEFSETLQEVDCFLNEMMQDALTNITVNDKFITAMFNQHHNILKHKIIYSILEELYEDNIYLIEKKHIDKIVDILLDNENKIIDLPNNVQLIKSYDSFTFETNEKEELSKVSLEEYDKIYQIEASEKKSNYITRLNSKEIKLPLFVRGKKDSDRMSIKNLNGHKLISDIFINEKVPSNKRGNYPLLVDSNDEILWIPGIKKSKFDKDKSDYYDIILEYKEGELK